MTSPESPFQAYRAVQRRYDADLARVLERTAKAIRARLLKVRPGIGGEVRRAQLRQILTEIDRLQRAMWRGDILGLVVAGQEAGIKAAEDAIETLMRPVYAALPEQVAEAVRDGLRVSALSGLASDRARRRRELSPRVYHQQALSGGVVEQIIRQGLISNLSARELARDVYRHVSPTTPGGASYAAMRLARTEINNAFHERQIAGAERPGVTGAIWNLSGSHKVPDDCNLFAAQNKHDMGRGVFPPGKVPDRPHPQCFCYLTYKTMTARQFKDALSNGDFDSELDRRTKENLRRMGFNA